MRSIRYFIVLLVLVSLIGITYAESCRVVHQQTCLSGEYKVMGLSSDSNAHGELLNQDYYDWSLCCDFERERNCGDGDYEIVGLTDSTNAHASAPDGVTDGNSVCYGGLNCTERSGSCLSSEIGVLSLSDSNNAHLGTSSYNTNHLICCNPCLEGEELYGGNCVSKKIGYWSYYSDGRNAIIDMPINVVPDRTEIYLVLNNSRLNQGDSVSFNIYELDDGSEDDFIRTIAGTSDEFGNSVVKWIISQEDLEEQDCAFLGWVCESAEDFEFFFNITQVQIYSELPNLEVNITNAEGINFCRDYKEENSCETDFARVASRSIPDYEVICGYDNRYYDQYTGCILWQECGCVWEEGTCLASVEERMGNCPSGSNISGIGTCTFIENTLDDCSDGILEFSWNGIWNWHLSNYFDNEEECSNSMNNANCVEESWHADPYGKSKRCREGGSSIIPCTSEIPLPFFTLETFLATLVLLGVIYYFWNRKQKSPNKKKKVSKKRKK